jgi:hypothetical protein
MAWHRIHTETHAQISREKWARLWRVAGYDDDTSAVFAESGGDGTTTTYYLSPGTRLLAQALLAIPCPKPAAESLKLIAGRNRAWTVHFSRPSTVGRTTGYEETAVAPLMEARQSR